MGQRLLIVGAGGHGQSVAEAALLSGKYEIAGFADDALQPVRNWPVLGAAHTLHAYQSVARAVIIAIGNNRVREDLCVKARAAGFELVTVVHPAAFVAASATIGAGSAIMAGAVIGTEAALGEGAIVNCGSVVDHHCVVEDFAHVGTNASMAGGSILGRGAWMQAGAALAYGTRVPPGDVVLVGEARG